MPRSGDMQHFNAHAINQKGEMQFKNEHKDNGLKQLRVQARTGKKMDNKQNLTLCLTSWLYIRNGYPIRPTAEGEDKGRKRR